MWCTFAHRLKKKERVFNQVSLHSKKLYFRKENHVGRKAQYEGMVSEENGIGYKKFEMILKH